MRIILCVAKKIMRKILLLNGMTPGGRVFRRLAPLLPNCEIVEWISPECASSIADYARRLVDELEIDTPCDVLGVSFGGIVAQELASLIGAESCFVVSSISSPAELKCMNRILSRLPATLHDRMMSSAGEVAQSWPGRSSAATVRARKFGGDDGAWFRWAAGAALRWKPLRSPQGFTVVRVHGDRDRTFPRGHMFADHVIEGADHLLAITHAKALAEIVADYSNGQNKNLDRNP